MKNHRAYKVVMHGYYIDKVNTIVKENLKFENEKVRAISAAYFERIDQTVIQFQTDYDE